MQEIAEHLPITEGADRLMTILKRCGYKIAILSGGFTYFGEYLQRRYGIDYVYANELEIGEDGKLTGRYVGEIVDGHRKAELLKLIAQVEKVNLAQTIAVGDGANDLPMISEAGLGIAFHAKPRVVPMPSSRSTPSASTACSTSSASRTPISANRASFDLFTVYGLQFTDDYFYRKKWRTGNGNGVACTVINCKP